MANGKEEESRKFFGFLSAMYRADGAAAIAGMLRVVDPASKPFTDLISQLQSGEYNPEDFQNAVDEIQREREDMRPFVTPQKWVRDQDLTRQPVIPKELVSIGDHVNPDMAAEFFETLQDIYKKHGKDGVRYRLVPGKDLTANPELRDAFDAVAGAVVSGNIGDAAKFGNALLELDNQLEIARARQYIPRQESLFVIPGNARPAEAVYNGSTIPQFDLRELAEALGERSGGQPDANGLAWKLKETLERVPRNKGAILFRQAAEAVKNGDPGAFGTYLDTHHETLEQLGFDADARDALKAQVGAMAEKAGRQQEVRTEIAPLAEDTPLTVRTPQELQTALGDVKIPQRVMEAIFDDNQHLVMGKDGVPHRIDLRDGLSPREMEALRKVIMDGDVTEDCPGGKLSCPTRSPEAGRSGVRQ